ncbi:polyketide synthase dehydratase domain-containing protein [Streptomyces sp. NRRL F-525]|uniref:polyketide synthase dehydratase domain-containing protein n=1 Tax=Streptomyces sp. NRRL F-525 TaxID=1463861 RepID=UPI003B63C301
MHAGNQLDAPHVEELTLEAPLALPEQGTVHLQLVAASEDGQGRRAISVHSRPTDQDLWTRHATGTLATTGSAPTDPIDANWPPNGATSLDTADAYEQLAELGLRYGPVFQGLQAAWRDGDTLYADIALPKGTDTTGFGIHPALLDATLHGTALSTTDSAGQLSLPFAWNGITLHATEASTLRARIASTGPDTVALTLADPTGAPVATIGSLTVRPITPEQLATAGAEQHRSLFAVDWVPVSGESPEAVAYVEPTERADTDDPIPGLVLAHVHGHQGAPGDVPGNVHATTQQVRELVQQWLADERSGPVRPRRPR